MNWNNGVNTLPMKYRPRLKVWKSSNNVFNPETMEAHSYEHWKYLAKVNGKVIFNGHYYSPATAKHQSQLKVVLKQLGVKIDITVDDRRSLSNLNSVWIEDEYTELFELEYRLQNAKLHPRTRVKVQESIDAKRAQITLLRSIGLRNVETLEVLKKNAFASEKRTLEREAAEREVKNEANRQANALKREILENSWVNAA